MRARSLLLSIAAPLVFASLLSAQQLTATLVGQVTDAAHARVPGAAVQVRNVDTNQTRIGTTNADGVYTISELPPGVYEVIIDKTGFKQLRETKLELKVDETARLDATLQIGARTETIEVRAEVPLMNTENSARGDVIAPNEIEQMPLNGRDFDDLAFNVPGVQPSEERGKGSPYVVNGTRADASGVYINGINDQNPRDAGAQARPPLDSLQEFKLETSGYSAQYGRLAGGVVNMALKTGSNGFHGSLFEFVRNDIFDASNYFAGTSKLRRNQFGGTLGGPVAIPKLYNGHDRTFFLVSWESFREVHGTSSIGVVPTQLEISGDFSKSVDSKGNPVLLKDPNSSNPCTTKAKTGCFPGNKIPANRINALAQSLALKYYPCATCLTPGLPGNNNYQANGDNGDDWNSFVYKIDHRLTQKDNLSVFLLNRSENSTNPFSGSPLGVFSSTTVTGQKLLGISETRIFSPTLINEFRAGLTRTTNHELADDAGTNFAAQLGISGTTSDPSLLAFPKFSINGYETIGDSANVPIRYTVNDYDYSDVVTMIRGKHTIKFGGDVLHIQYFQPTNSNFNGTFSFSGTKLTTNSFADFLLGLPNSTSRKIGTVTNHIYSTNYATFFQDDYKVLSDLTLNLGLRYEIQLAPTEKDGQESNFVPQFGKLILAGPGYVADLNGTVASAGLTGLIAMASDVGLPKGLANNNYNNFGPRVGFAWRPLGNNRTVIRGGYGIFYTGSRLSAFRTDFFGGFPFSVSQSFTAVPSNVNALTLSNPFPAALAKTTGVTTSNGFDINAASPYLQSWNLTVEHEIGKGIAAEAGYVGSKGSHLGRKFDLNQEQVPSTNSSRPFPAFGDIEYYLFGFNSYYDAGILTLRKRFQNGMFFRANYTYGKSIDTNSGLNYAGAGGYQGAQNSLNPNAERGRSDFDIRHVFSMNFAYMLPFTGNQLIRGWQLAGSGAVYSGQPFTPQMSGPNGDQGLATRPDRIGNGGLPDPSPNAWYDLNAFDQTPAGQFGNSGRNILDGPGSVAINLSLSKQFYFGERTALQLRWEAFNVTNHPNFKTPNINIDTLAGGTITTAKDPRIMQLGARLQF